jgi:hypothetical protein
VLFLSLVGLKSIVQLRRPGFHFGAPTDGVAGPIEVNAELDSSGTFFKFSLAIRDNDSFDIRTPILKRRRTRTNYANSESDDEDSPDAELGRPSTSIKFRSCYFW